MNNEKIAEIVENLMDGSLIIAHVTTLIVGVILLVVGGWNLISYPIWYDFLYFGGAGISFGLHWIIRIFMIPNNSVHQK